jgi:glycine/D-amino acid oxidase-like deaminating enzyme
VSVSGTGEAGATVVVTDGTTSHNAVVNASGNWSVIFTALSDGPVTFTASQTDLAGNTSPTTSTTITIDTAAPVLIFTDDVVAGPIGADTFVVSITDTNGYNT